MSSKDHRPEDFHVSKVRSPGLFYFYVLLRTFTRRTANKLIRSDLDSQWGVYGKSTIFVRTMSKKAAGR